VGAVTVADRLREALGRDDFEGMISVLDPKVVLSGPTGPTAVDLVGNLMAFCRWRSEG
jgi:hypothetical protein